MSFTRDKDETQRETGGEKGGNESKTKRGGFAKVVCSSVCMKVGESQKKIHNASRCADSSGLLY